MPAKKKTPNARQSGLKKYRERISAEKRADVLKAARTLFAQQGFPNTGMAEIARLANVSSATMYKKFPSKEDLMQTVIMECEFEGAHVADTFLLTTLLANPSFAPRILDAKTDAAHMATRVLARVRNKLELG
ncbi:MAG: helix-turn-helix domain containing protein [Parvibaculaceae bacterium]|nr:helix-turn-helix domain containing protein [Parvibaculaceae bacterium]